MSQGLGLSLKERSSLTEDNLANIGDVASPINGEPPREPPPLLCAYASFFLFSSFTMVSEVTRKAKEFVELHDQVQVCPQL